MNEYYTEFISELTQKFGRKYIYLEQERLEAYDFDGTDTHYLPDVVIEPISTEQVSDLMKLATH